MSTYIQLCKDWRRDCGISGTGPTTVLSQVGELARGVDWVRDCYTLLQNEQPNWRWLRGNFTLQTVAETDTYAYSHANMTDADTAAAISRWTRWWTDEFQIYLTSAGIGTRHWIPYNRWENHKSVWHTGSQNSAYPSEVSIDPQNRLRFGAKPDAIYTVTGEYQKGPQILVADLDEPEMPSQYHQLIVAMAVKRYGAFHGAPEVWAEANRLEGHIRAQLELDQLSVPRFGNPLC